MLQIIMNIQFQSNWNEKEHSGTLDLNLKRRLKRTTERKIIDLILYICREY